MCGVGETCMGIYKGGKRSKEQGMGLGQVAKGGDGLS